MKHVLMSLRGIGQITLLEVPTASPIHQTRNFDLIVVENKHASDLLQLRTVEDVFALLGTEKLSGQRPDLSRLTAAATDSKDTLLNALSELPHQSKTRVPTVRIVAQAEDASWRTYRRVDMQKAVQKGVVAALPKWKWVDDNANIEIWVIQSGRTVFIALRLSDISLRQRTYKTASLPASLRPSIAGAMAVVSKPQTDDIVLDPMCGAGTVLIERAMAGRYKQLIGGDLRLESVDATKANFGAKHKPWTVELWDATDLPLQDNSVDAVITNPPWGKQIGNPGDVPKLYNVLIFQIGRVLKTGGRAVLLTSERAALHDALLTTPNLKVAKEFTGISALGQEVAITVINKA